MWAIPRRKINLYRGELKDIAEAIFSGTAIRGKEIDIFESAFAEFIGAREVITISSGRAALKIILESLELPKGSEIIIPAYTAAEVPGTILSSGFKPVFVDINDTDHNIDTSLIEKNITPKTKAIIGTHLFGTPCGIEDILRITQKYYLFFIEDCAHSLGAEYKGKKVGNFSNAAFFSFANSKPFNTFGGGAVSTNDAALAHKIRDKIRQLPPISNTSILKSILISYILYYLTKPQIFTFFIYPLLLTAPGFKSDGLPNIYSKTFKMALRPVREGRRFSNLQAIVGLRQLELYKQYCIGGNEKIKTLVSNLSGGVRYLIRDKKDYSSVPYFFVIVSRNADLLQKHLLLNRIDTGRGLMRYCPECFGYEQDFPKAREALINSVQLPLYDSVNEMQILKISEIINKYGVFD
jgi:dTDP-4-amino-4,6-dideoxygalactose transaminase